MSHGIVKVLLLLGLLLVTGMLHAQQPGVDCNPVQGQGWQGCAPINQQQPRAPRPPLQHSLNRWGAIATDSVKHVIGTAVNMLSQGQAEQAAMAACQTKGGAACKQDIWYSNQCVAMVAGDTGYDTKAGATINDAVQAAMKVCSAATSHCRAYYSACSLPILF